MVSTESVLDGCNILSFKNKKSLVCNLMLSIEAGPWVYDLDMLRMHFRKVTIKMAYLIYKKRSMKFSILTDGPPINLNMQSECKVLAIATLC
jgi:hypothetical protein